MKKTMLLLIGAAALISLPHVVLAEGVTGLFISLKLNDVKAYEQWQSASHATFQAHRCEPFRSGKLLGGKGTFKWGNSNQFALIKCQSPALEDLVSKGLISDLSAITDELSLTEGDLNILSNKAPSEQSEYLIKVSYFNNLNPKARLKSLAEINARAKKIKNGWVDDAILQPTASVGVIQSDNLAFLYYPKASQGNSFRENNLELMTEIGSFNKIHVERVTYLAAQVKNGGIK